MVYRPPRATGILFSAVLGLWAGLFTVLLAVRALTLPVSLDAFLAWCGAGFFALLTALFVYWTYCVASLRYIVDRDALAIQWGLIRQLVPLQAIERLIPGRNVEEPSISGLNGPGVHVGRGRVQRVGETVFYSTHHRPDQLLYVVTPQRSYGLTIEDAAGFAAAIQDRQGGELLRPRQSPWRSAIGAQGFWSDPWAYLLIALALAAGLSVAGFITWRYPLLPDTMEIPFPTLGDIIRVGPRGVVLQIALTALAVTGINIVVGLLIHRLERMAAYLLWGAAIGVQGLFWAAAINSVG